MMLGLGQNRRQKVFNKGVLHLRSEEAACLRTCALDQGFSNFWCYGAHEEIDHNLRSPTRNF